MSLPEPLPSPEENLERAPLLAPDSETPRWARTAPIRAFKIVLRATILMTMLYLFWFGAFLLSWFVLPVLPLFVEDEGRRRRTVQGWVGSSYRVVHSMLTALDLYKDRWAGGPPPRGATVIVANHPSLLDFTAIAARCPDICCVVKPLLMRNPFVGPLLRAAGHVVGDAGSFADAERVMAELTQRLAEGHPVLIFPEGTRSPVGGLHPFRRGAFRLACRAGVPVTPIYLDCHPPALAKNVSIFDYPAVTPTLTIEVGEPLSPEGRTAASLKVQVEQAVRRRKATLDAGGRGHLAAVPPTTPPRTA